LDTKSIESNKISALTVYCEHNTHTSNTNEQSQKLVPRVINKTESETGLFLGKNINTESTFQQLHIISCYNIPVQLQLQAFYLRKTKNKALR